MDCSSAQHHLSRITHLNAVKIALQVRKGRLSVDARQRRCDQDRRAKFRTGGRKTEALVTAKGTAERDPITVVVAISLLRLEWLGLPIISFRARSFARGENLEPLLLDLLAELGDRKIICCGSDGSVRQWRARSDRPSDHKLTLGTEGVGQLGGCSINTKEYRTGNDGCWYAPDPEGSDELQWNSADVDEQQRLQMTAKLSQLR